MCVIFFSYNQHPKYPLILLANRDEFYDRPTKAVHAWDDGSGITAGRDLVGKGTWLGVTESGRFSAVTNFRDPNQPEGTLSRGALVADFLKGDTSSEEYLKEIAEKADEFTGFNLLVGQINRETNEMYYFSNKENEIKNLKPGLYGLSNHLLDTPWRKVEKGKNALRRLLERNEIRSEKFFDLLSDKTFAEDSELPDTGIGREHEKLLSSIFIETPVYGTRCSTVLLFDESRAFDFEERVFV